MNRSIVKGMVFVAAALLSLLLQEALARGSMEKGLSWIFSNGHQAFGNLLIIVCIFSIFVAVSGRIIPGVLCATGLLAAISFVNHMKIAHLQKPLFPWDFVYFEHIFVLFPTMSPSFASSFFFFPVLAGIFILFCVMVKKERSIRINPRVVVVSVASLILSGFIHHHHLPVDLPGLFNTENAVWDQQFNYQKNGLLLSMAFNVRPLFVDRPVDYSHAIVSELLQGMGPSEKPTGASMKKPANLILFLSESFYDLVHVRYEADCNPLENLNRFRKKYPHFRMISPTFGGGTSGVEFEVLTGLSNAFLPEGAVPFDHYLRGPLPSIAGFLGDNGYRTIALHPFHEWFWNRNNAYPFLGFNEYYFLKDFENAEIRGRFVSDEALVDRIIATVERIEGPYFIHALSMQNHGVYDAHRYAAHEVQVKGDFPEWLKLALQTFVTGVRDADVQLGRLLDYLEKRKEATLVLFCGDHLPTFGEDFALYREGGAILSGPGEVSLEEHFKMASVPCLLWSNKKELLRGVKVPENLSPIYIPPLLLGRLGVEMPKHYHYLARAMGEHPVIHSRFLWTPHGGLTELRDSRDFPFVRGLELLQYDILFGAGYSLDQHRHVQNDADDDVEGS